MREDIVGGLKNAMEKGESIELAVQSFINAGYSPQDVQEAAQLIGRKVPAMPAQATPPQAWAPQVSPQAVSYPAVPTAPIQEQPKAKEAGKGLIVTIVVLLVIVLAGLGFLLYRYLA